MTMATDARDTAARTAVVEAYTVLYEHHAEEEQVARAVGDESGETAHHWAVLVLFRALTAEQVPS